MADKKKLFQPQIKEKWLFGMEPLEPIPLDPHCKRWYRTRDRLPPNYLAKNRHRLLKWPMDSRQWIFMRDGRDDFRTGCPPADNTIIHGPREGFLSMTAHRVPQPPPRKTHNKLSEGAELLSKLSPAQEAGKAFKEETKASLTRHPVAGYPGLKESLPPDLSLTMLEEIDPDKKLEDKWAYIEGMKDRKKSPTKLCERRPEQVNLEPSESSHPGTSQPSQPGTSGVSQSGPPNQVKLGPPSPVNWDLLNKLTWHLPDNSTGDLPAKVPWEQLVKSSWDLLAKSTMNSRPSQLVLPGQVNQGPPKQVNRRPPKQVNQGHPKKVNQGFPKQVNQGPLKKVNRGFPMQVNQGPPKKVNQGFPRQVNQGPPKEVNQEPSDQLNQESPSQVTPGAPEEVNQKSPSQVTPGAPEEVNQKSPSQVTPGAPEEVNQKSPKDSFLSYLLKLFPEEKKKKKSRRKGIPKTPDPYRYSGGEVSESCKWTDTFEDMGIDEKFTEQFEIDDECTPNHNMGKIKKVTQIPVELYYSKELDDNKKGEFTLLEGDWERKLRKPSYLYRPEWLSLRYGAWYLNPRISKKKIKDEPWVGPKALKEQKYQHYRRALEPDILDDLYGPIAFKDFIVSKGYRMPGVIENLFLRKKWTYDSVKTPVDQVIKLLSEVPDDTSEGD